ncbi:MAG: type 4a pilus biogenesis protein PilO [Candidatus Cloacimonetes bacterium]|nr:type 4a pilus biogenesis protein PilO [Candidatus Cloacimonadota bacterium]
MKEKYLVFILAMVLISVLFFMLASNSLKKNLAEVDNYDKKIKTTLEKLNSAMIMDQQLREFREIIDNSLTYENKFSVEELNEFQLVLDRIREDNKMKMEKISDSNKFSPAGMIETTYNLELQGTFRQMGQFISELEGLNHIIKFNYLDVSPIPTSESAGPGGENNYRVSMEITVFKVKKEAK